MADTQQIITPQLRQWIDEQMALGFDGPAVLQAMKASGWSEEVAKHALAQAQAEKEAQVQISAALIPDLPADQSSQIWVHDKWVKVLVQIKHPRVVVLADFLSVDECLALMAAASPRLARSETVALESGGSEVNAARTSQGMFFARAESELCARIEARIAAMLNWPVENGEGIQVLRYPPKAEYKAHYDYFDPTQPGTAAILKRGGQRVGTVIMYLNTPEQGGATVFPDQGMSVMASQGHAVFFAYGVPHPSTLTLHGGAPVEAGEKWIATKWLREDRFE